MKVKRYLLDKTILAFIMALGLSSCGSANNVAQEAKDYAKVISNELAENEAEVPALGETTPELGEASKAVDLSETEAIEEVESSNKDYLSSQDTTVDETEDTASEDDSKEEAIESNEEAEEASKEEDKEEPASYEYEENKATEEEIELIKEEEAQIAKEREEEAKETKKEAIQKANEEVQTVEVKKNVEEKPETAEADDEVIEDQKVEKVVDKDLHNAKVKAYEDIKSLIYLSKTERKQMKNDIKVRNTIEEVNAVLENIINYNNQKQAYTIETNKLNENFEFVPVVNIVDGDTIDVVLDGEIRRIRFIGINTPETKHPNKGVQYFGREAEEFTKTNLDSNYVWLEKDITEIDKYGRTLRYIWLTPPADANNPTYEEVRDSNFCGILVRDGYANTYTYAPDVKYNEMFLQMEQEAMSQRRGMWY